MPSSKSSLDARDIYYRQTKSSSYRARSAFKLLHLDEEYDLFTGVRTAVDLCAAPGSWSQVLGEKLRPGRGADDPKVVSLDLQPMAPLPNIIILQTDITLPSTIPLVIGALGGRKADLVVCDGAPDVTGVHDLDAYLHSQLLLAALTLSLTLLAPHGTLIFKIFLSPLDAHGPMLKSQLRIFFPGPPASVDDPNDDAEFDDETDELRVQEERGKQTQEAGAAKRGLAPGFDLQGRLGGVWVRRPRSSRKGTAEAFLICRNFDPSQVPLPPTFSHASLDELARHTTATLTLESLAHLTRGKFPPSRQWDITKAYTGSGDLNPMLSLAPGRNRANLSLHDRDSVSSTPAQTPLDAQPTPIEGLPEYFGHHASDTSSVPPPQYLTSESRMPIPARRAVGLAIDSRGSKISLSPPSSLSPTFSSWSDRLWDQRAPSPLPSPNLQAGSMLSSREQEIAASTPTADGTVSPALSTSSRTSLFFSASQTDSLPVPPKPLPLVSIGKGLPSTLSNGRDDRAVTTPAKLYPEPPSRSMFAPSTSPLHQSSVLPVVGFRSVSSPTANPRADSLSGSDFPLDQLSTLPTQPDVLASGSSRRESQVVQRERREVHGEETSLCSGDVLTPESVGDSSPESWRLDTELGRGAFSSVWSGSPFSTSATSGASSSSPQVAAIKLMDKRMCASNARTRIAFVREVEVLRHISHPSIVAFISSFSTTTHHCLVLEKLDGGELFDLVSDQGKREAAMCPSSEDPTGQWFMRRVFGELCKGVGWLHEVGVVHRDIKLENIILTCNPFTVSPSTSLPTLLAPSSLPSPLIKITDFGLSRYIDPTSPLLSTRCGSESYAAPEIIMGKEYDGRDTDSWAVGVVGYGLVVGELPFDGVVASGGAGGSSIVSAAGGASSRHVIRPTSATSSATHGRESEEKQRKRRMMNIARGRYTWPGGEGVVESVSVSPVSLKGTINDFKRLIDKLLVRDPKARMRVGGVWSEDWMSGVGDVRRGGGGGGGGASDQGQDSSGRVGGDDHRIQAGRKGKRVQDGFLVDGVSDIVTREEVDE